MQTHIWQNHYILEQLLEALADFALGIMENYQTQVSEQTFAKNSDNKLSWLL